MLCSVVRVAQEVVCTGVGIHMRSQLLLGVHNVALNTPARRAFEPLVEEGYVKFAYGGGKEGAFLSNHPLVSTPETLQLHVQDPAHCLFSLCVPAVAHGLHTVTTNNGVLCRWAASC